MTDKRIIAIEVTCCADCPFYSKPLPTSPLLTRKGVCKKTGNVDSESASSHFMRGCPYKQAEEVQNESIT